MDHTNLCKWVNKDAVFVTFNKGMFVCQIPRRLQLRMLRSVIDSAVRTRCGGDGGGEGGGGGGGGGGGLMQKLVGTECGHLGSIAL